jgi:hypothetical protein
MTPPVSVNPELRSGHGPANRTSGERDASRPQVRGQPAPFRRQRGRGSEFRGGGTVANLRLSARNGAAAVNSGEADQYVANLRLSAVNGAAAVNSGEADQS